MEPDLDRLLDLESGGALFPQFSASWSQAFEAAVRFRERARREGFPRPRIAIATAEPLAFSALFIAFCRGETDLFLFNPSWGRQETAAALAIARPHWIVGDEGPGDLLVNRLNERDAASQLPAGHRRLRVMIATGGTSGAVRFAMHDWDTLAAATRGFQQRFDCARMAAHCVLPLFHVSGFMQLVRALLTMGSVVYGQLADFEKGHRLLVATEPRDRFLSLVATQLERLVRDPANMPLLKEYRAIFIGGGPAPEALLQACRDAGIPLAPTYGMTETAAQVATLLPERFLGGDTTQGKALPHARISIVAEEAPTRMARAGERGLIRIAASSLFKGYYGQLAHEEGPIITSDLGVLSADGSLTVIGRADRAIISGGEKIGLREVEACVERTGLTRDVVAFGIPDAEWGERLAVAYVPREESSTEQALREAVAGELAGFKMPKVWKRCSEIPRNDAGKPLLRRLLG